MALVNVLSSQEIFEFYDMTFTHKQVKNSWIFDGGAGGVQSTPFRRVNIVSAFNCVQDTEYSNCGFEHFFLGSTRHVLC